MIDAGRLVPYGLTVLALFLAPGPSVVLAVSRGIALGRAGALVAVVGNTLCLGLRLAVVVIGPAGLLGGDAGLFHVLKILGAAFLVLLGIRAIQTRRTSYGLETVAGERPRLPVPELLGQGLLVGLTNPKGLITFTSIAPAVLHHGHGTRAGALLLLGLIALTVAFLADAGWGLASGTVGRWLGHTSRRLEGLNLGSGVLMILFGAGLAVLAVA